MAEEGLLIRRLNIVAENVVPESKAQYEAKFEQLDLFTDYEARERIREAERTALESEKKMQKALIKIKGKYGKNAILNGISLKPCATARERNSQIGGHRA